MMTGDLPLRLRRLEEIATPLLCFAAQWLEMTKRRGDVSVVYNDFAQHDVDFFTAFEDDEL